MRIDVSFTPGTFPAIGERVCIVVDALRATSVIPTLFARGCAGVYVAGSHASARAFARSHAFLLCGETDSAPPPDFDHGNSPLEFADLDLSGQTVVLSTSNGTKAIAAVAGAAGVLIGSAVNRRAVAARARQTAYADGRDILILCAGSAGEFSLEDAHVAGMLVEAVVARAGGSETISQSDAAIAARSLWEAEPRPLQLWFEGTHARDLADAGFGPDVGYCAQLDTLSVVPELVVPGRATDVSAPVYLAPETG